MATPNCYWFTQGKCQLSGFEPSMVYNILARVPQAREDLLNCTVMAEECDVDQAFIDFASNEATLVVPQDVQNQRFKDQLPKYEDVSRLKASNPTTPKSHLDDDE